MEQWPRYVRTLRYVKPGQVLWRARRMLGWHGRGKALEETPAFDGAVLEGLREWVDDWVRHVPADEATAEALRGGRVRWMGQEANLAGVLSGVEPAFSPLWRYQVHGFKWLRALWHAPEAGDRARILDWMHQWMDAHPPGTGEAWDGYPLSWRIVHWAAACAWFQIDDPRVRESIAWQTSCLAANPEYDVCANHLLINGVALTLAQALTGKQGQGLELLRREVAEQVLADGGQYERSLMYHAEVLEACLAAHAALTAPPQWLGEAIGRMAGFLEGVRHPDGDIPLFGDAVLGAGPPPGALIALARERCGGALSPEEGSLQAFEPSGFYVLTSKHGAMRMILKAGGPGPAYQLGHAHGDALSFELSAHGTRMLVDSGVHGYAGSPWREYVRSTRAHNTVSVDGRDQLECWDTFRVGRRYAMGPVRHGTQGEEAFVCAEHDGFRPFIHRRHVASLPDGGGGFLVGDEVLGPHRCRVESFLHIHPEAAVEETGEGWTVRRGEASLRILPFGPASAGVAHGEEKPRQGWYCPAFGTAIPASVLILRWEGTPPLQFGYAIVSEEGETPSPGILERHMKELYAR